MPIVVWPGRPHLSEMEGYMAASILKIRKNLLKVILSKRYVIACYYNNNVRCYSCIRNTEAPIDGTNTQEQGRSSENLPSPRLKVGTQHGMQLHYIVSKDVWVYP